LLSSGSWMGGGPLGAASVPVLEEESADGGGVVLDGGAGVGAVDGPLAGGVLWVCGCVAWGCVLGVCEAGGWEA